MITQEFLALPHRSQNAVLRVECLANQLSTHFYIVHITILVEVPYTLTVRLRISGSSC